MNMEEKYMYYLFITANIPIFPSLQFRALSSSLLGCFIAVLISACRNHLPWYGSRHELEILHAL